MTPIAMNRRNLVLGGVALSASLPFGAASAAPGAVLPSKRPPHGERAFTSPAVEDEIKRVKAKIADPQLAWLFENCYPNTLDTTVQPGW